MSGDSCWNCRLPKSIYLAKGLWTLDFEIPLLASGIGMAKSNSTFQKLKRDALAIWDESFHAEKEYSRLQRFLHFWVLVIKSFNRNSCPIRASALSFATLLAIIPMLAVAISVTSALLKKQGEDQSYHFVDEVVSIMVPAAPISNAPPARIETTNAVAESGQTNSLGETPVLPSQTKAPSEAGS